MPIVKKRTCNTRTYIRTYQNISQDAVNVFHKRATWGIFEVKCHNDLINI